MATAIEFRKACERAVKILRKQAPKDTGNLAYNGIRIEFTNKDECHIYVDDDWFNGIAPYMKYTNEDWAQFKPPLQGRINPNEGWWDDAMPLLIQSITKSLKGELQ
jgi:hypothetical protein